MPGEASDLVVCLIEGIGFHCNFKLKIFVFARAFDLSGRSVNEGYFVMCASIS